MMQQLPRPNMRRAIVLLPNGFTLGNLFFGVFAIVSAYRGDLAWAGWCVVLSGLMDALDGRVARMTRTVSRFGVELDSLVDAVSFGVAPAFIIFFAVLNNAQGYSWIVCFIYIACVVMRLARFNIEQGGRAKTHFHGLPSPAAGMTLATYYWFSQTALYTGTPLVRWPWHTMLPGLMLVLSFLMISHVLYPVPPLVRLRSWKSVVLSLLQLAALVLVASHPTQYVFPALMTYVAFGLGRTIFFGLLDNAPRRDPLNDTDDEHEYDEDALRPVSIAERPGGRSRRQRFPRVREAMNPFSQPREEP